MVNQLSTPDDSQFYFSVIFIVIIYSKHFLSSVGKHVNFYQFLATFLFHYHCVKYIHTFIDNVANICVYRNLWLYLYRTKVMSANV